MEQRLTRSNGRETMAKVLVHARNEIDAVGPVKFNILRVIEAADVSRSSVYHHFGGRDGVIAAVEVQRLIEEMKGLNDTVRTFVLASKNVDEVLATIRLVLIQAGTAEGKKIRAHRLSVMATAQNIEVLADTLREEQARGDAHMAETFRLAASHGLISELDNPQGTAHLISSLFIGRSIVDVIEDSQADSDWVDTTMKILEFLFKQ